MSLENVLGSFREYVEDSYVDFRVIKSWKEENDALALAYFPVYFPEELAHSLGFHSVGLFGASGRINLDKATAHTQSFVCSISRSVFQLALDGRLGVFDVIIFSNICDVARNLSGITKRNIASKYIDYLHYPINNTLPEALEYLRQEYVRLARGLEKVSGRTLTPSSLRDGIALHNRKRALLRSLTVLLRSRPWLLTYLEYYSIVRAGSVMPVGEYIDRLSALLPQLPSRQVKPMDKLRVVVLGNFCEQPPLMLMRTIEEAGCYIVNDEAMTGVRWIGEVDEGGSDPLLSLARAYIDNLEPLTVRYHPAVDKQAYLLRLLKEVKADAVVFLTPKFCEPALYDYMIYKMALDKAKVPYLHIEYEESGSSSEYVRTLIETFVESILFD